MQFQIKQYTEISKNDWDKFVYENSMGWAYHLYDVIPFNRNAHFKNISFCIVDKDDNDKIYMLVELYMSDFRKPSLLSEHGFIIKDNLPPKTLKKIKKCFETIIDGYMKKYKMTEYMILFPPLCEANLPTHCSLVNPAIHFNFCPGVYYTSIIDLSKPDNRMLADCEETTRQAIRKIEASNKYEIIESKGATEDLKIYTNIHKETYLRTGADNEILSDIYNENIFFKLIPQGISRVFFLKEKESDTIIAYVNILIFKNSAYYWWGGSLNQKEVGVNKYLLFNVIQQIRQDFNKTGYFETGGTLPYLRKGKYKGLGNFKKSFGTFLHPIYTGHYQALVEEKVKRILCFKIKYKVYD